MLDCYHPCGFILQGLHRLEKYLNLEGFLEKPLKIKSALKSTGKSLNSLLFYYLMKDWALLIETYISIKLLCLYLVQHMLHQIEMQQF